MHWTAPFTIGIPTRQAAVRLRRRLVGFKGIVNFQILITPTFNRLLLRVVSTYFNKLEIIV